MRDVFRIAVIGMVALLTGCVSTREYPRCYLFRAPAESDVILVNKEATQLFSGALGITSYSLGKDAVVATSSSSKHARLESIWPGVGCVNLRRDPPENSEINDKWIIARCQGYLQEVIQRERVKDPPPQTAIAAKYKEFICN